MQEHASGDHTHSDQIPKPGDSTNIYTSQGISHIAALIDAPLTKGITDKLFICSAEDLKIEVELPGPLLNTTSTDYRR